MMNRGAAEFDFDVFDGHLIFAGGGRRVLLDTGSPQSFGGGTLALPWRDGPAPLVETFHGTTIAQAREEVAVAAGVPFDRVAFDAFLGCDLLRGHRLTIDWRARRLAVGAVPPEGPANDTRYGHPLATLRFGDGQVLAIADTGARISFVRRPFLDGLPSKGTRPDFVRSPYGGFERIVVRMREAQVTYGGQTFAADVGLAEGTVDLLLQAAGVDAVIGTDVMSRLAVTNLDLI